MFETETDCVCVYVQKRCLLTVEEILDGWKESESEREHKREKDVCV